eukprot:85963-Pelagomonas_calceolata.AAC.1
MHFSFLFPDKKGERLTEIVFRPTGHRNGQSRGHRVLYNASIILLPQCHLCLRFPLLVRGLPLLAFHFFPFLAILVLARQLLPTQTLIQEGLKGLWLGADLRAWLQWNHNGSDNGGYNGVAVGKGLKRLLAWCVPTGMANRKLGM